jgi:hypothetical protein
VRGRSFQVHTEKVAKHEARKAIWGDNMMTATTATKFSPPGSKPSSEAAASVNASLIDECGARGSELPSPLYDDHVAPPLRFNGTQLREEGTEDNIATGCTIDALIDALLQIGDSEEWDSVASMGTSSFYTEDAASENAIDDKSMVCGVGEEEEQAKTTKNSSAGVAWEEPDARRAWEDMKRRVMHIEESDALPLDGAGAGGAGDTERASREFRARRRRSWAEKTIRGHGREDASRRAAAKKRRRHAGCWVREDGAFMRLVSFHFHFFPLFFFAFHRLTLLAFTVRTSNVSATEHSALWALGLGGYLFRRERLGRPMYCPARTVDHLTRGARYTVNVSLRARHSSSLSS